MSPQAIRALQPGQTILDDVVPGLRVRALATKKCWYLWFRTKAGIPRNPKIGDCDILNIAEARAAAKAMLLQVANGEDPVGDRVTARGAPTVNDLWEKFSATAGARKKTRKQDERYFIRFLAPRLGNRRVQHLAYEDAVGLHASLSDTPYQANRVLGLLSKLCSFSERPLEWRSLNSNPCRGVQRYPELKRRRYATPDEFARIGRELAAAPARYAPSVAFILLLIYSGARPAEIGRAQRSWIERQGDAGVLRLPDSKVGQRHVYLPPQAMRIVDRLPAYPDGTICGMAGPEEFWRNLRKRAGCPDLRMYPDLRRSFATSAVAAKQSIDVVGGLLGHANRQTTLVYARLMEEVAQEGAAAAGNQIEKWLGGGPDKADVGQRVGDKRQRHAGVIGQVVAAGDGQV